MKYLGDFAMNKSELSVTDENKWLEIAVAICFRR
jgi:hypothetical protein